MANRYTLGLFRRKAEAKYLKSKLERHSRTGRVCLNFLLGIAHHGLFVSLTTGAVVLDTYAILTRGIAKQENVRARWSKVLLSRIYESRTEAKRRSSSAFRYKALAKSLRPQGCRSIGEDNVQLVGHLDSRAHSYTP